MQSIKKGNFSASVGDFTHVKTTPFQMTALLHGFMKGTGDVPAEGMFCPVVLRPNTDKTILTAYVLSGITYPGEGYLSSRAL